MGRYETASLVTPHSTICSAPPVRSMADYDGFYPAPYRVRPDAEHYFAPLDGTVKSTTAYRLRRLFRRFGEAGSRPERLVPKRQGKNRQRFIPPDTLRRSMKTGLQQVIAEIHTSARFGLVGRATQKWRSTVCNPFSVQPKAERDLRNFLRHAS